MSKELTPLEVLKQLKEFVYGLELGNVDKLFVKGSFNIIETELKRLEEYDKVFRGEVFLNNEKTGLAVVESLVNKIQKQDEVLRIIKEIVNFSLEFDDSQNEWFLYISNDEHCVLVVKGTGVKTYELLKEVLL